MVKRKIVKIDESKCDGCGLCISNCHEGALRIIDGKARLVNDAACDGLGACLGHCPQGAITLEEAEAGEFDERAAGKKVKPHLSGTAHSHGASACPGSRMVDLRAKAEGASRLRQWPIQMALVPPTAPYFENADLLIAADCVPFAYASFHEDLLKGRVLIVGCPKLDDIEMYTEKISAILKSNSIKSVTYAHMEVPCCFGLAEVIRSAISASGKDIPFKDITITIDGKRRP